MGQSSEWIPDRWMSSVEVFGQQRPNNKPEATTMTDKSKNMLFGLLPAICGIASVIAAFLTFAMIWLIFNSGPGGPLNNMIGTAAVYLLLTFGCVCGLIGVLAPTLSVRVSPESNVSQKSRTGGLPAHRTGRPVGRPEGAAGTAGDTVLRWLPRRKQGH